MLVDHFMHEPEDLLNDLYFVFLNESVEGREAAIDLQGVYRDALTEFWDTFYERLCFGFSGTSKLPRLKDGYRNVYKVVGQIIKKGFVDTKYFPVKIAKHFFQLCMFGKFVNDMTDVVNEFLNILPNKFATAVKKAMIDFNSVPSADIVYALDLLEGSRIPKNSEELKKTVEDLALMHFDRAEKIKQDWSPILSNLLTEDQLNNIYEKHSATAENINRIIPESEQYLSKNKSNAVKWLGQFVHEFDNAEMCELLLRFITGSNMIPISLEKIDIHFLENEWEVFKSNTCSFRLFLPIKYRAYEEFTKELRNILKSKYWSMDDF